MKRNRSIPSKSASKGKAPKPSKAPVQRRVSVGKDARSGESLATEPRNVATSANETSEPTNSPTAAESATTPNVGEEEPKTARSKKGGKAPKAPKPSKAPKPLPIQYRLERFLCFLIGRDFSGFLFAPIWLTGNRAQSTLGWSNENA